MDESSSPFYNKTHSRTKKGWFHMNIVKIKDVILGEGIPKICAPLVKSTARFLIRRGKPWLVPGLVVKSGFKFLGYRAGKCYRLLPKWLILKLTMNREYWKKACDRA